ncbi:MAG TPA: hypothetical protein VFD02_02145 [Syntrophomonadaceae bacterium]|nr:hypothetical protein [Syntrophomonadaceae bacterium]
MRRKQVRIPKTILKGLAEDIQLLMQSNPGRIAVLEMIEELPFEIRLFVLESLSAFYSEGMVSFFHLIQDEYGQDVETLSNKALNKYAMAGLDTRKNPFFLGSFYKAYASSSRSTGRITLDVAWHKETGGLHVECFYLTFNADGIHSFFLIPDMPFEQYNMDREVLSNMVEISQEETVFLISQAFNQNLCQMTRPAVGKFLYNKYLESENKLSGLQERNLTLKLTGRLTPRQTVNSFFDAIKYGDTTYIDCICPHMSRDLIEEICQDLLGLGTIILEGQAGKVYADSTRAEVTAHSLVVDGSHCFRLDYRFIMKKALHTWLIEEIVLEDKKCIDADGPENPHNLEVFCRVYEIIDLDELFELLDQMDNIKEVVELPFGLHLRIITHEEDFNSGVSFLNGSLADIIINGDELVVICREPSISLDIHDSLLSNVAPPLISRGEYLVDLITAYNYINGRYASFEDVLIMDIDDLSSENDLRFMSTIYFVKDRDRVLDNIKAIPNVTCAVDEEFSIFYQYEYKASDRVLLAEYVLGEDWLTLSTFGYNDMHLVRQNFEPPLYNYLEFEGMEIKEGGFFDILTVGMKRNYPGLEKFLKELYLNKWYNSCLNVLGGMSPSEASKTVEGEKLLWGLIKKIHQTDTRNLRRGKPSTIKVNEYINLIEEKRKEKQ